MKDSAAHKAQWTQPCLHVASSVICMCVGISIAISSMYFTDLQKNKLSDLTDDLNNSL